MLYRRRSTWHYDFTLGGQRYRGSTKEKSRIRAEMVESKLKVDLEQEQTPLVISRSPLLSDFAPRFLAWLDSSHLMPGTRRYYRVGWGMIRRTRLIHMKLNRITSDEAWAANFPGSPSAVNNALRTLHRMLSKAVDWKGITRAPKIHLAKEVGRSQLMSPETEAKLLSVADQPLRDVIMIMQDGGMRPAEVFRMSVEHIDWQRRTIFVPFGKTRDSRRFVPMSERVMKALMVRVADRSEGWVFPSKRSRSGHIETVEKQFLDARGKAELGDDVVLYSARHTFCTYALEETGNLAALMKVAGHADIKTAMKYQHPETDSIREAIERRNQCHNSRHSPAETDGKWLN